MQGFRVARQWSYSCRSRLCCSYQVDEIAADEFCACEGCRCSICYLENGLTFSIFFYYCLCALIHGYHNMSALVPAAKAVPVTFLLWIQHDLVREGVRITSRDGRYVVFVSIDNTDYLHSRLLQRAFHCPSDLLSFCERDHLSVIAFPNTLLSASAYLLLFSALQS